MKSWKGNQMTKKITSKSRWFYLSIGCIIVSLLSSFLPIFRYGTGKETLSFNIIDLVKGNEDFNYYVLARYSVPVIWHITSGTVSILAIVAVAALICAVVGLITLRAQIPNTKNFILTIIGLIGILIPSLTAIICVVGLGKYYTSELSLGIASIISPIAILISIGAVIRRKNKVAEEMRKEVEEKGLIWKAGDL